NLVGNNYEILKYKRDIEKNRHYQVLPALRLSEMYYIASECSYDADPAKGLSYLNIVRASRGMGTDVTANNKEELLNELVKDARKEMYAEGQLFYMYKRLNRTIVALLGSSNIPPGDQVFVMPLPVNEIEFGQR
ncbi:MAG: RagB/SusD family nutrient uptake outer membrane protein, partial [Niastella sp.]|uniref:RagB/SusD family nutrient uptake outer membrane protein n=1 Tax=Niastella sp. TaxID=1869183 RepID=UPI003899E4C2